MSFLGTGLFDVVIVNLCFFFLGGLGRVANCVLSGVISIVFLLLR